MFILFGFQASKAALIGFFEALRIELAPSVTITIATLGIIDSEMSRGKILSRDGELILSPENSKVFNFIILTKLNGLFSIC